MLLKFERPLCGLPEAGVHWFRTNHKHHRDIPNLHPSTHDNYFLYTPQAMSDDLARRKVARGSSYLQTDNTANIGNRLLISKEALNSAKFDCKAPIFLKDDLQLTFNGATITRRNDVYFLTQPKKISNQSYISTDVIY